METLVLNSSFAPVNRVSWRKAFSWIFTGRAVVVAEYLNRTICSPSEEFPMPSIIRFLGNAASLFRKGVKFNRQNVYLRDKGRCQYCGRKISKSEFTYDHVVPRGQGGVTKWTNVVIACFECNQRKANRTPEQAKMWLRTQPVKPRSLPGQAYTLRWDAGMPSSWKDYVSTVKYWHSELDS